MTQHNYITIYNIIWSNCITRVNKELKKICGGQEPNHDCKAQEGGREDI